MLMNKLSVKRCVNYLRTRGVLPAHTVNTAFRDAWEGLERVKGSLDLQSGSELAPQVRLWFDGDGEQSVSCRGARGGGITLEAQVNRPGRWLGLHFALGDIDLSQVEMLGIYAKSHALRASSWRACVRSGRPDGFVDHFFEKHGVSCAAPSCHMDMMELAKQDRFPKGATWRELVIFFHVESFNITLRDLRLFSV